MVLLGCTSPPGNLLATKFVEMLLLQHIHRSHSGVTVLHPIHEADALHDASLQGLAH